VLMTLLKSAHANADDKADLTTKLMIVLQQCLCQC